LYLFYFFHEGCFWDDDNECVTVGGECEDFSAKLCVDYGNNGKLEGSFFIFILIFKTLFDKACRVVVDSCFTNGNLKCKAFEEDGNKCGSSDHDLGFNFISSYCCSNKCFC
jgi:hypothetical protein